METLRFILGSQSPRRKEILEYFSLPFEQIPSSFEEESIPFDQDPLLYALSLAKQKAATLAISYPDAYILTADTVVHHKGQIYNKPKSHEEALQFLQALINDTHEVYTALCLAFKGNLVSDYELTRVTFHNLTLEEMERYITTFSTLDKAGGYGIQKAGSLIVKKIEGCFYNVMGLPLNALTRILKQGGINLWDYLK